MGAKRRKAFTITVFALYLLILVWIVVFKLQFSIADIDRRRELILIPFSRPGAVYSGAVIEEMILNVLAFIPVGYGMALIGFPRKVLARALAGFLLSLVFETVQYVFSIGTSDVTDLINNTLGVILGGLAYRLARAVFKSKTETVSDIVLLVLEVLFVAAYALLLIVQ